MNLFEIYDESEIILIDVKFLGLNPTSWDFQRGARTSREYIADDGTVCVRDAYDYVMTDDNRSVTALSRTLTWFDGSENAVVSKGITPQFSAKKLKELNRNICQGRIDYLESAAEHMRNAAASLLEGPTRNSYEATAASIDALFDHFGLQVAEYISRGTLRFEEAVRAETDSLYAEMLDIQPTEYTIRQSILYQLTGDIV